MHDPLHRAYPEDLAAFVRERWKQLHECGPGVLPPRLCQLPEHGRLTAILSTAYQATLLREEERAVTFRLILGPHEAFPLNAGPPDGLQPLAFTRARPLTAHELRRLSPAAKYHRTLIGVELGEDGEHRIWGLLQSGPRWLDNVRGGRRALPTLPAAKLVVHGTGPGQVAVASGSLTLGEIRGGAIRAPALDLFASQWLTGLFIEERAEVAAVHLAERHLAGDLWAEVDQDLVRTIAQQMLKRIVATMRGVHHGGALVVLPSDDAERHVTRGLLHLKYAFADEEPRRRFRTLMLAIMRALGETHALPTGESQPPVGWNAYGASDNRALAALDEAVFEVSHLYAGLADVDGAVVITKRFEVLGFGAEIVGGTHDEVHSVHRALDLEGEQTEEESIEGVGTRHRSAYRLCHRVPGALAVVVSHDGTVRFVTAREGRVLYWDHVAADLGEGA